ncbi:hypothetical protein [Bradyrhizobium sp. RDI18]|uniref:hypothetical protein n=1 Tax=Bradyrhizobium sp. RDI18 TaxID=3367400 RepID=UPI003714BF5F
MCKSRLICAVTAIFFVASSTLAQQQPLPSPPPPARSLEFTGPEAGWPPQVKGLTDPRIIPFERAPTGLTSAFAERLGEVAASSPIVHRALGERFAFLGADLVERDKIQELRPLEQQLAQTTFYSYSRNVAVRALVRGGEVVEVKDIEGYQPPESPGEVEQAVRLARGDPNLRDAVRDLEGRALVTERGEGQLGAGHRVLYVSFLAPGSARTEFMALVDLTDGRVLEAGRPAGL